MNPFHHAILTIQNSPSIYYDGTGDIGAFKSIDPGFTFMCGKNPVDGYLYYVLLGKGGPPDNKSNFVFKLDIDNLKILQEFQIEREPEVTSTYDTHLKGVISFDDLGNIYVATEVGKDGTSLTNGHNTDFLIYKTATPGDLSTLFLWQRFPGWFSYPKLWIFGDTLFLNGRGSESGLDTTKSTIFKSADAGENWTSYNIMDLPSDIWSYTFTIHSPDSNEIIMVLNARNRSYNAFESISVMRSTDGITWSNWENTFSKNVDTDGPLTYTEIQANMLLFQVDPVVEAVNFEGGIVKNGEIKVLVSTSETTGIVTDGNVQQKFKEFRLYSYSSGWDFKDLSELIPRNFLHVWARERTIQYVPGSGSEDFVFVLDRTDTSNCKLIRYKSSDGFNTYQIDIIFEGAGDYYYGSNAFNAIDQQIVILTDVVGGLDSENGHSNIRIIKV